MKKYRLKYDLYDNDGSRTYRDSIVVKDQYGNYYTRARNGFDKDYVESNPDLFEPVEEEGHIERIESVDPSQEIDKINELVDAVNKLSKEVERLNLMKQDK